MPRIRLIPRLDIKGENLVKSVQLEGLRVLGKPQDFARRYCEAEADELIFVDVVASLYQRNSIHDIIRSTIKDVFVPLTVVGGLRSTDDVRGVLLAGADKVGINTAATKRPKLISEVSEIFGAQCMVLSIEAKQIRPGKWEVYNDNGRERTGLDVIEWAAQGVSLGAGEILLTSIDREGTRKGFDLELIKAVSGVIGSVPLIASGGMGSCRDMIAAFQYGADAAAMADVLHYGRSDLSDIREAALQAGYAVRGKYRVVE